MRENIDLLYSMAKAANRRPSVPVVAPAPKCMPVGAAALEVEEAAEPARNPINIRNLQGFRTGEINSQEFLPEPEPVAVAELDAAEPELVA